LVRWNRLAHRRMTKLSDRRTFGGPAFLAVLLLRSAFTFLK
jgi:hypothetical protein